MKRYVRAVIDVGAKRMDVAGLTDLGRTRLSKHFFMREMLYSEVANAYGLTNAPETPDLAIEAGRRLCEEILEPLHDRFGHVSMRSAWHAVQSSSGAAMRHADAALTRA